MTTNYQALGEHTAYIAQARDAAMRLRAILSNTSTQLQQRHDRPTQLVDLAHIRQQLDQAEEAQRELQAALARANQAAALCGQRERDLASLDQNWRAGPAG